jgi:ribosome maturation factor RimP
MGLFVFGWAARPVFICGWRCAGKGLGRLSADLRGRLLALVEPLLAELGCELVELEVVADQSGSVLRVYIDKVQGDSPAGVMIEDCERVSHALSAALEVNDPMPGAYTLEVSTPGADRILRTSGHYLQFVGERVHVELLAARAGRRRYTGQLDHADANGIELTVDGVKVLVNYAEIARTRLAPLLPEAKRRRK